MQLESTEAAPVVDVRGLLERCLGNLDLAERVLARFEERFDEDLSQLEEAVRAENAEAVARIAHRLKGASANTGARRLAQRAAGIEELARRRVLPDIASQMEAIRNEFDCFAARRDVVLAHLQDNP